MSTWAWQYKDRAGVTRVGDLLKVSDQGETYVTYHFKRLSDGVVDLVSGTRLRDARRIEINKE